MGSREGQTAISLNESQKYWTEKIKCFKEAKLGGGGLSLTTPSELFQLLWRLPVLPLREL